MNKEFNSDFFDDASAEWRKNKLPIEDGSFRYRCCFVYKNGDQCIKMTDIQNSLLCYGSNNKETNMKATQYCVTHLRTGPQGP
jgi:hypothetical protein